MYTKAFSGRLKWLLLAVCLITSTPIVDAATTVYDTCPGMIAYLHKDEYSGAQTDLTMCVRYFEYGQYAVIIEGYSARGIFRNGFD